MYCIMRARKRGTSSRLRREIRGNRDSTFRVAPTSLTLCAPSVRQTLPRQSQSTESLKTLSSTYLNISGGNHCEAEGCLLQRCWHEQHAHRHAFNRSVNTIHIKHTSNNVMIQNNCINIFC